MNFKKLLPHISAACLIAASLTAAWVQAAQIYRWTDDQGTVHFSQHPPQDGSTPEPLNIRRPVIPKSTDEAVTRTVTGTLFDEQLRSPAQQVLLSAETMCQQARDNMDVLEGDQPVSVQDDDGRERLLSAEERAQEVDLARAHIEVYCQTLKR